MLIRKLVIGKIMKRYVKSNLDFRRYYSATSSLGNRYQIIAEGDVTDDSLKLRIGRAISNGRKVYAYGLVGQKIPGKIEVYYQGKIVNSEEFGSFLHSSFNSEEYLDELAFRAVELTDEVNEALE